MYTIYRDSLCQVFLTQLEALGFELTRRRRAHEDLGPKAVLDGLGGGFSHMKTFLGGGFKYVSCSPRSLEK